MSAASALHEPELPPSSPALPGALKMREDHVMSVARFRPPRGPMATPWSQDMYPDLKDYSAVIPPTADNEAVFNTVGRAIVDAVMQGKNASCLAYGGTSSGKTFTLVGGATDSGARGTGGSAAAMDTGLLPRCVRYLFDSCNARKRAMRFRVSVSIVEVYQEQIRDLIPPDATELRKQGGAVPSSAAVGAAAPLQMREKNGVFFLPDANIRVCSTAEAVLQEIAFAFANRTTGNSFLSDVSSRAHAIATVSLAAETNVKGAAPVLILSRMSFVDLCGSEVLTDAFGSQQQSETKSINKSLFALRGVVSALAEKASFVPYRDSELTKLLKATLSRESVNCIICTLSPDLDPAQQALTQGSIAFGNTARRIEQDVVRRVYARPDKVKMKDEADEDLIKIDDIKKQQKDAASAQQQAASPVVCTKFTLDTRQGPLEAFLYARSNTTNEAVIAGGRVGIALHAFGGGCYGADLVDFARPSIEAGHVDGVFAVSMPGFGGSAGARQTSRTESLWQDKGPMEVVIDLLEYATDKKRTRSVLVFGWDWGGNMALSLAINSAYKNRVRALLLYHPSWTAPREALAAVKAPTLLLWDPTDTLHLIAHGRQMAKLIAKSKLVVMKPPAGQSMERARFYDAMWTICGTQSADFVAKNAKGTSSTPAAAAAAPKPQPKAAAAASAAAAPAASAGSAAEEDDESSDDAAAEEEEELAGMMGVPAESLDDLSDFSRESSFLGVLLNDPEVVDAMCAAETAKRLRTDAKKVAARVAKPDDPGASALFEQLARCKLAAVPSGGVPAEHVTRISTLLNLIASRTETRLALAFAVLGRNAALRSSVIGALGLCPVALPYWTGRAFQASGLLPVVPKGAHDAAAWAGSKLFRYLPGRSVQVPLPMECLHLDMTRPATLGTVLPGIDAATLMAKRAATTRKSCIYTWRARVVAPVNATTVRVAVEVSGGAAPPLAVNVSLDDLEAMNAPTAFKEGPTKGTSLVFEDAIRARYDSLGLRLKVAEICADIAPLVAQMDFDAAWRERVAGSERACPANNALLRLQCQCVIAIRKHIDIVHHVQCGRDPNRALVPDVGSLALHGNWHCHGCASTLCGMLLPFASVLGIDVRQRDGYCGRGAEGGRPIHLALTHTWSEVTFQPSGANFVTDPSFSPHMEPTLLTFSEGYCSEGGRYPMRDLVGTGPRPALLDARQCALLHEGAPTDADVRAVAALKQMVFDDASKSLTFVA